MRGIVLTACVVLLGLGLGSGCFRPDVKNGGFACSMTDNPPCPQGFFCVSGLCQNHPGAGGGPADLSTGTGGNGGGGGGGGGGGASDMTAGDLAHAAQDLSSADLAQPPMCGAQGASCSGNSDCCKMACILNVCFF